MNDQLKQFRLLACVRMREKRMLIFSPFPAEQRGSRKMSTSEQKFFFVFPNLQKHNLLLLYNEHFCGHLSGHVNTLYARIWKLENAHEVLESQRDSPKLSAFCAISRWKLYGPFIFGEPTVTGSTYFDALSTTMTISSIERK
ncbi:uncharacterized protein TNCV_3413791 [Trichonephila clavipes]|uniref:Uncharacterized protein n=1 Tax=Trichonephila clavipes TaxID=2585209 RepID=A0A8X6RRV3_TRICX|nr:uncharacterized protein TNCV_3413791 [Trichonephila clavipes]